MNMKIFILQVVVMKMGGRLVRISIYQETLCAIKETEREGVQLENGKQKV